MELAKLANKNREEADNAQRKVRHDEKRKAWIKVKQEGFISKTVRDFFADLKSKPARDPLFRKAVELTARCLKNFDEYEQDDNAPPIKKPRSTFRAEGGGRKPHAVDFRQELFGWFVDVRYVFKARLPKHIFLIEAKKLYQKWLKKQEPEVPVENQLKFSDHWIYDWMAEYGISFQKPNKRFALKQEDRIQRIEEYIMNVLRVRKWFIDNFDIEPPIINGDQMPLHRNETHNMKTMSLQNTDCYVKENYMLSRERVTCFTQVCSDEKVIFKPEFVFKGVGKNSL